ncbi:MAG TPA: tRNA (N6-isopentenyl adenosine(37)-C2)-methylthiotransferase MiaB [Gaiellaceae bacterium]
MRRYYVTTFGCQMNAHDSERIKGMLEELGLGEAQRLEDADLMVFNTCTIREKAESRLAAHLGLAKSLKDVDPGRLLAVGGCFAEVQREHLFEHFPQVDFAFGPGSIAELGEWLKAERNGARGSFGAGEERRFAAELPARRERPYQAWVQISMGCNSVCSYCIVPTVRGKQMSRSPQEIIGEVKQLAGGGVREVTLLGQNVNSYGRDLAAGSRLTFAELLRECNRVDGIERIRFTSPHPKDFRRDLIAAMAECASVCEHAHLPAQSGSSRILKVMRRTYDRELFLALVAEMRAGIPDLAITSDLIVGFPGETDEDFEQTLSLVEEAGFDGAYTFVYSPRYETEAASLPERVPEEVKGERIKRLIGLVQRIAEERNRKRIGETEQVLVEGPSRTDETLLRGRTRRNTTVNFTGAARAGELVGVHIEDATSTTLRGAQVGPAAV